MLDRGRGMMRGIAVNRLSKPSGEALMPGHRAGE